MIVAVMDGLPASEDALHIYIHLGCRRAGDGRLCMDTCEVRMADEDLGLLPRLGISLYTMRPDQHCTERAVVAGIILPGGLSEDSILGSMSVPRYYIARMKNCGREVRSSSRNDI